MIFAHLEFEILIIYYIILYYIILYYIILYYIILYYIILYYIILYYIILYYIILYYIILYYSCYFVLVKTYCFASQGLRSNRFSGEDNMANGERFTMAYQ